MLDTRVCRSGFRSINKYNFCTILFSASKVLHSADLYWSFEDSAGGVSHDAVRKRVARLMGGARVVSTSGRGHVADTSEAKGWISLGDFKGTASTTNARDKY